MRDLMQLYKEYKNSGIEITILIKYKDHQLFRARVRKAITKGIGIFGKKIIKTMINLTLRSKNNYGFEVSLCGLH